MTNAFEILAVCGGKSHLKTTYATMPCDLTIYKVAVHFFILSQVCDNQNLCRIFLSHR